MNVKDVFLNTLQSSAAVEIMNEVVLATLKSSLESCKERRLEKYRALTSDDKLDGDRGIDHLTDRELDEWDCLVEDIVSFERVIDYYGG